MKKNEKMCAVAAQDMQMYVAPEMRTIEVHVEKGFAGSQQEESPWDDM